VLSHITIDGRNHHTYLRHCVLVLKVHRLRQLLPLNSRRGFCPHGAVLGTSVLRSNRCATPAKLPGCQCPARLHVKKWNAHSILTYSSKRKGKLSEQTHTSEWKEKEWSTCALRQCTEHDTRKLDQTEVRI